MQVEWEKSSVQELDITATDLSTECLIDMLTRIPTLRFLSAGQLNGFNDQVLKTWIESGNIKNLVSLLSKLTGNPFYLLMLCFAGCP